MLRSESRPERAEAFRVAAKIVAVSIAFFFAGCSAEVTRFNSTPMFGLTGSANQRPPIPREGVWSNSGSRLADSTPYDNSYRGPSYGYAGGHNSSAPYSPSRPVTDYASAGSRYGNDQPAPSRPDYRTPPYRTIYETSPGQPAGNQYQPPSSSLYGDAYRPEGTRMAALPPQSTPGPKSFAPPQRGFETTSPRVNERSAPVGAGSNSSSPEIEVQPGDTLYGIAERYDLSISELMTLNGLTSPVLRPGQRLMLPKGARVVAGRDRPSASNDTPTREVAAPYSPAPVSAQQPAGEEVSAYDSEADGELSEATDEATETYIIQQGESLYRIAVSKGVSLAELMRINNIDDPRKVRAGTVLKLPPSKSAVRSVGDAPPAPLTIAEQPGGAPKQPDSAPATDTSYEPGPNNPVIINAQQKKRIAALNRSDTLSDAPSAAEAKADEPQPPQDNRTAEEQADGVGKFRWPVRGRVIAGFGKQPDGSHSDGIKLAVPVGTDVHAAESGVVVFAGSELKDYGNLVLIRHDDGWITAYAHNDQLLVKRGDRVRRGQVIAKAGKTGKAETPQLHFELRKGSSPVDPIPYLE